MHDSSFEQKSMVIESIVETNNRLKELYVSRLCLCEENCRGGTEVSVKITCDVEENIMF